uniref:Telomere repeats-binding bouquet formation protein 1 n=1 Tax=Capra hircus TaxID=9925 RepID=A0A8C2SGZ6_CAPHI
MDNAFSQKEALVTIHSICQQNSNAGLYFREIGGLMFVKNLAKSSEHSMVKEAALYTLGAVAEQNVYCQQTLCTSELFEDLIWFLSNSDSNTNLKRMSVYVILVLVSNNRTGQTLVRETGCISVLSQLFKTVLSKYELNLSDESALQSYQLWSSVCSTLCVCVNNPQNDENQMVCSSLFMHANDWLINCMKAEIIRPIFLVQLESDSHKTPFSAKLAVVVTKTVDACIYHIVSKLLALLLLDSLDSGEKFSVILTLGHCTEDCEENQYDFFKNNGLPLMIQALTESQSEELNKAATFVLHNCKKISEKLSLSLGEYSFDKNEEHLKDINMKEKNLEDYWKKAKEILHRIEELETKGNEKHLFTHQCLLIVILCLFSFRDHIFKHPTPITKNTKQQLPVTDPFTLCSDIINKEVISFLETDSCSKMLRYRCSGCIAVGKSLNSRNFSKLLHCCPYQCDRHKAIVEAEDRYKSELRKSLICNKKILLTPRRRRQLSSESTTPGRIKKRRIRKNFTKEEINYLFNGVKKMGNHWNLILWSFPFQQGRKAVDLAHKYHKLTKCPKYVAP